MSLKSSRLALGAAFLASSLMVAPTASEAGWRSYNGYYGHGYDGGPYGHGYHGGPYGHGYPVHHKRRSDKGAIAAALIGGIALGAILASTQRSYRAPRRYYSYARPSYRPVAYRYASPRYYYGR